MKIQWSGPPTRKFFFKYGWHLAAAAAAGLPRLPRIEDMKQATPEYISQLGAWLHTASRVAIRGAEETMTRPIKRCEQ